MSEETTVLERLMALEKKAEAAAPANAVTMEAFKALEAYVGKLAEDIKKKEDKLF